MSFLLSMGSVLTGFDYANFDRPCYGTSVSSSSRFNGKEWL